MNGRLGPAGNLRTRLINSVERPGLRWKLRNLPNLLRAWRVPLALALGIPTYYGTLRIRHFQANGCVVDYGLVSARVVTTAFVNFVVDQLQTETSVFGDFKYHDSGVGTTAEAVGDTDIETTDGESRATGTQAEGATANIYKSVGTIAYTTTKAITEHALFNASTGVTLMDRTVFSAINVGNGDSIEFTYELTLTAGS
jgi:hypothetical protein